VVVVSIAVQLLHGLEGLLLCRMGGCCCCLLAVLLRCVLHAELEAEATEAVGDDLWFVVVAWGMRVAGRRRFACGVLMLKQEERRPPNSSPHTSVR
jgi:hypothetical protein